MKLDFDYHQILTQIKEQGYEYSTDNRSTVHCKQLSSVYLPITLTEFPILTTKEVNFKNIVTELLWFLRGEDNIKFLVDNGCNIWNKDAYNWYVKEMAIKGRPTHEIKEYIRQLKESGKLLDAGFVYGDVGRNYGVQWRDWTNFQENTELHDKNYPDTYERDSFDQIQTLLDNLRKPNPISRRHIVTAWNPAEISQTTLPSCHWAFEIIPFPLNLAQKIMYSGQDPIYLNGLWEAAFKNKEKDLEAKEILLDKIKHVSDYGFTLKWHQRSVDTFLGLPYNITSYALLSYIIGKLTNMIPFSIIGDLSNVHIYSSHFEAVEKQMANIKMHRPAPVLTFSDNFKKAVEEFEENGIFEDFISKIVVEDFILTGYESCGEIKAEMVAPDKV
jgi:thymidylate synthase